MATWTTIPNSSLEPGKPIRSIDALALRDNPVAIAEGATGAPKIQTIALQPPEAGNTHLIFSIQDAEVANINASYLNAWLHRLYDRGCHLGIVALVPGVIRMTAEHRMIGGGTAYLRIVKNGVQQIEWSTTSTSYVARSADISVDIGDSVIFQQLRTPAFAENYAQWRNLRVYSANKNIAVA